MAPNQSTEEKLALLAARYPHLEEDVLLELLVSCGGSVRQTSELLGPEDSKATKETTVKHQTSLKRFFASDHRTSSTEYGKNGEIVQQEKKFRPEELSQRKRSKLIHLYTEEDVAKYLPYCTLHLNVLPIEIANELLRYLLKESKNFSRNRFMLFDRWVDSPHKVAMFSSEDRVFKQHREGSLLYNGQSISGLRPYNELLAIAQTVVEDIVNYEIDKRGREKYQAEGPWKGGTAVCNVYDGRTDSVAYHSDRMTNIGPQAVIGSVSLGCTREFRLKHVNHKFSSEEMVEEAYRKQDKAAQSEIEEEGDDYKDYSLFLPTYSIHLPHNSLLIMHAHCQEEFRHSLVASSSPLDLHPISGQVRINLTYRHFRPEIADRAPKCKCDLQMILRRANNLKTGGNRGRYFWSCAGVYQGHPCGVFHWADFESEDLIDRRVGSADEKGRECND